MWIIYIYMYIYIYIYVRVTHILHPSCRSGGRRRGSHGGATGDVDADDADVVVGVTCVGDAVVTKLKLSSVQKNTLPS